MEQETAWVAEGGVARGRALLLGSCSAGFLALVLGCIAPQASKTDSKAAAASPRTFVLGADISALDSPWRQGPAGERTYQENGVKRDELSILRNHGWSAFRVRVFVSPVRDAPNNTLEAAVPLAKRIKDAGATFLLCIHLSDTWADPQHQEIPVAWRGLDPEALEAQVESYCFDTVKRLKDAGAMPDWVQVGNEITRGTLWPVAQLKVPGSTEYTPPGPYDEARQWSRLTGMLKAGIRGVNRAAADTPPRIAVHIDKGANWKLTQWFFDHLEEAHVPYDIIAQSFYPEWNHGTLDQLVDNMRRCAERYKKDFLVVETGYGKSRVLGNTSMHWPQTPIGRLQYMADIVTTVQNSPRGIGVMYWAPEWEAWNDDGSPGPVVSVLDKVKTLAHSSESHIPPGVIP